MNFLWFGIFALIIGINILFIILLKRNKGIRNKLKFISSIWLYVFIMMFGAVFVWPFNPEYLVNSSYFIGVLYCLTLMPMLLYQKNKDNIKKGFIIIACISLFLSLIVPIPMVLNWV